MRRSLAFAAASLGVATASTALAAAQTCSLDAAASHVAMTLKTNHDIVHGTFQLQSGSIDFEQSEGRIGGSIVVGAGTGKTGNDARDRKMDREILNVPQYATITFAPRSFTGKLAAEGESEIRVSGILTLLGSAHEITVPMKVQLGGGLCAGKGQFVVPYVSWGMKAPDFLFWKAEHDVTIDLDLKGKLKRP